ncbi:MAG TPA: efflux transporter outer membrane subunit [Caulobacteraceae bacterium]|jgi:NodT family efflux transporter outer membrane factor (OMF) lipoprotein|nr:efflux transporter outer membrane subunit [Caulobacteraceae bacterium]
MDRFSGRSAFPRAGVFAASLLAVLCGAPLLFGCTVGPDFARPPPPTERAYGPVAAPQLSDPGGREAQQHLTQDRPVASDWWALFASSDLDALVRRAATRNQTLAEARAALAQAREGQVQARAGLYPQADFGGTAMRLKTSLLPEGINQLGPLTNDFAIGPSVSYALDIFGGERRLRERADALALYQRDVLDAAYLSVTGAVARTAIDAARAGAQLDALEAELSDDEATVQTVGRLLDLHYRTRADLEAARSQVAEDRALAPPLRQQLAADRDALQVLAGDVPSEIAPDLRLDDLALPPALPLSVPSQLVRRRPDIRAAEAQLHAASAAIGVSTAQLYPSLALSAAITQESLTTANLFSGAATGGFVAASLAAPLFHGGELRSKRREAVDAYDGAYASYRQTVLEAFGQVADVLQALDHDAQLLAAERQSIEAAQAALTAARTNYQAGRSDILRVLATQRQLHRAQMAYIGARAQRYLDTVQFFAAMGGGT